jgi:hypothetical protein
MKSLPYDQVDYSPGNAKAGKQVELNSTYMLNAITNA